MIIMSILRFIFVIIVCLPLGYLLLSLCLKLIDLLKKYKLEEKKRKKENEKRSFYYNGRP